MRITLIFILLTGCFLQAYCQKTFNLVLDFDQSFDPGKITWSYNGGKGTINNTDTFTSRQFHLKGKFYGDYATVDIRYNNEDATLVWINSKTAHISFRQRSAPGNSLLSNHQAKEAIFVYECEERKRWEQFGKTELQAMNSFYQDNPGLLNEAMTDSSHHLFKQLFSKMMLFIKEKPDDYHSKWFFRDQLVLLAQVMLKTDTAYFSELYDYFNTTFSNSYRTSEEGKYLGNEITIFGKGKTGDKAPYFKATDLTGKTIELTAFKGKYVLLDFWATWCPPCMGQMPFIKSIREKYTEEQLVIIGISEDRNLTDWKKGIRKEELNWFHILDANEIPLYFGVTYIPHLFLIDRNGQIVYSSKQTPERAVLLKKLEEMK